MTIEIIKAPKEATYIKDFLQELPINCILDKVTTGSGATYTALTSSEKTIIAVPTMALVKDKVVQDKYKHLNILPVSSEFEFKGIPEECRKIICTYNSLEIIYNNITPSEWNLVIDEMHMLPRLIGFAKHTVEFIEDHFKDFKSYCFVSATVLSDENTLSWLRPLHKVQIEWPNIYPIDFKCLRTNNIVEAMIQIYMEHKEGRRLGKPYFFVNSTYIISRIHKSLSRLKNINIGVITSRNKNTIDFLKARGIRPIEPNTPADLYLITSTAFEAPISMILKA